MKRLLALLTCTLSALLPSSRGNVFPAAHWEQRSPEQVGLSREKLDALKKLVGGRGCVVRHGYMVYSWGDQSKSSDVASAFKPVLSTLLLMAVQEGRLNSVDELVADFEPRLKTLNNGKDGGITWRHLASQTSGYGLAEPPGAAYSYNDFALALYYATLTQKVFLTNGTEVLRTRLAEPLQFEDEFSFNAFRRPDRDGRLALSVRDFARIGLLCLRNGLWHDKQLIKPEFIRMAINSPIPTDTPLTSGREADMLPGQHSIGGGKNITPVGPGYYSFNWWLNRTNKAGQRLFVDAPPDTYVASGHGGKRTLWVFPSLDLIVCWNDSPIDDHDKSPGNPDSKCNQAVRLMVEAVGIYTGSAGIAAGALGAPGPRNSPARMPALPVELSEQKTTPSHILGVEGTLFTVNGKATFLHGISYYGALAAKDELIWSDLDGMQRFGFNWIRVWANWRGFGADASAVDGEGRAVPAGITKLQRLVAECDRRGMIVDVTFSRGNGVSGSPRLQTLEAHRRAVETVIAALKPWGNWYLDLSNERNIRDTRFTSFEDLKALREFAGQLDPGLLVTASQGGDISRDELRSYLEVAQVDFVTPHRPRDDESPGRTAATTKELVEWMKVIGRVVPVHYQEPFRRGYGKWSPQAEDFVRDLQAAKAGGAAGWCFHNGDQRGVTNGQPRRSFDLREQRLFDQLDDAERKAVELLKSAVADGATRRTKVTIKDGKWFLDDQITYRGSPAEGLLMNVRMVNATFEDSNRPDFDPDGNASEFIAQIPDYVANGVRAFTLNLQGGMPGYEGAVNSAFNPDGSLRAAYMNRVRRVVEACDQNRAAVILGCFYQRQDQVLRDADAVRAGVSKVVEWVVSSGFANVALEISNEFDHGGFEHRLLKTAEGQVELIQLAKRLAPDLLVSTSGLGHGRIPDEVAQASDFILIHFNGTPLERIPERIAALKRHGKPIVCNEDDKPGTRGAEAARLCVANGASWGLMLQRLNQHFPFTFNGAVDDPAIYGALRELTKP
jgi:CubicO group peptidase (beta-lactamase class C family)